MLSRIVKKVSNLHIGQTIDILSLTKYLPRNSFTMTSVKDCKLKNPGIVCYEDIKNLPNDDKHFLIDVRQPEELKQSGQIPTSINIPLEQVEEILKNAASQQYFKSTFGRIAPSYDDEIIFTCRSGKRAETAQGIAAGLGYKNAKIYKGSWLDWEHKEGLTQS